MGSIQDLQLCLLKVSLLLGVKVVFGTEFFSSAYNTSDGCWSVKLKGKCANQNESTINQVGVLIIANGGQANDSIDGWARRCGVDKVSKSHGQAIGLVCNLEKTNGESETTLRSFDLARQFDRNKQFSDLKEETKADLENIVYVKGRVSHYFVTTPTKNSLLENQVLKQGSVEGRLLSRENINVDKLHEFARAVCRHRWHDTSVLQALGQDKGGEDNVTFKGEPRLFDFSVTMRRSESVTFVPPVLDGRAEDDQLLLAAFVGDSLVNPFWPEGLGVIRGFLSALDASDAVLSWTNGNSQKQVRDAAKRAYTQLKQLGAATRMDVLRSDLGAGLPLSPNARYRMC